MIPLVDLKAQYRSIKEEIDEAILQVLVRGDFIQGEDVQLFEQEFAACCGVSQAVGVSSGTQALHLALLACGVGPGDEVITTPFTFIATAEAISYVSAHPVFVDIDPETCNIDPGLIEAAITERTRAIIPVHLYGRPAEMDPIMAIAKKHGLKVIEDAAQSHLANYHDRRTGGLGDVGCFSFYPGKNLGAYGDAGMVVTNDPEIGNQVTLLRDHGRSEKYEHLSVGFNSRLDTLQAAILRVKLHKLEQWTQNRQAIAAQYHQQLRDQPVRLIEDDASIESVYHLMVLRTPVRDRLRRALLKEDIATGVHFPIPLHLQPAYSHLGYQVGDLPQSEQAAREVLSLPIYPELSESQVLEVTNAVKRTLRSVPSTALA